LFEGVLYNSFNSYIFSFHSLDNTELLKLENLSNFFTGYPGLLLISQKKPCTSRDETLGFPTYTRRDCHL